MRRSLRRTLALGVLIALSLGCTGADPVRPIINSTLPLPTTPETPTTPQTPTASTPSAEYTISLAQVGSSTINKLTSGEQPAWSPDGGRIAFISRRTGAGEIYVMKRDGTELTQLTSGSREYGLSDPTWSPDGGRIAFRTFDGDLGIVDSDGGNRITLVATSSRLTLTSYDHPTWSPDGQKILFAGWACEIPGCTSSQIYVVDRDGSKLRSLADSGTINFDPFWSPDGSRIAFVSNRNSAACSSLPCVAVYVMNVDGGQVTQLTGGEPDIGLSSAPWSPDGSTIAFQSYGAWGTGTGSLEVMRADGSGRRRMTNFIVDQVTWSPDGRTLLGTTYDSASPDANGQYPANLVVVPLSGAAPAPVIDGYNGDWSPDGAWIVFTRTR